MFWTVASAVAAELLLATPEGALRLGEPARVQVVCVGCGAGLRPDELVVSGARLVSARVAAEGGAWVEVVPTETSVRLRWPAEGAEGALAVGASAASRLVVAVPAEVALTDGGVDVRVSGAGVAPERVRVRASEGVVAPPRAVDGGLVFRVTPTAAREARPVVVGVLDLDDPFAPPTVAVVRLRARYTATLAAEPGARASLRIGGRTYGPFTAGPEGSAAVAFDALPGESSYELAVSDDLGNTQKLAQSVPVVDNAAVLYLEDSRRGLPGVWIAAADPRGLAWAGAAPVCRTGSGAPEAAVEYARARWRWVPSRGAVGSGETTVGCTLGALQRNLRLPAAGVEPSAIALRFYPDVLSADFPLAEVQATLIDAAGERLPPDGLELAAGHGQVVVTRVGDAVRGEYDGSAAAALGEDELRARWSRPVGAGAPGRAEVCAGTAEDGAVVAVARVLDSALRPLADTSVRAWQGGVELRELRSDARGYSRWRLEPGGAPSLRVEAGAATATVVVPAGGGGDPGCLPRAAPDRADLDARVRISIRSGRVRQVFLDAEPRTLTAGASARARVRIRMLDGAGVPVLDEPVVLSADEGVVGAAHAQPDGTLVAEYVPTGSSEARTVTITASSSAGTVSTSLAVAPRPVRGLVAAGFGWVGNFEAVSSPMGSLAWEHRLPVPALSTRVGLGLYGVDTTLDGDVGPARVSGTFVPLELGVGVADRSTRLAVGASLAVVVVPFVLTADFGKGEVAGGFGLAPPGVDARASAGWRLGQTEVYAEVGYLLYTAPEGTVSLAQNAGGLHGIVGYRLLY